MTDWTKHVLARPGLLALAAVAVALSAPGTAVAVTLGSTHVAESSRAVSSAADFRPAHMRRRSSLTRPPRPRFGRPRIRHGRPLQDPGSLQLLVLRKQEDGSFMTVRSSSVRTTATDGVNKFQGQPPDPQGRTGRPQPPRRGHNAPGPGSAWGSAKASSPPSTSAVARRPTRRFLHLRRASVQRKAEAMNPAPSKDTR